MHTPYIMTAYALVGIVVGGVALTIIKNYRHALLRGKDSDAGH
jgi:hypothetical protein